MRKLKLFFACLLMAVLSIGQMWAAEDEVHQFNSSNETREVGLNNNAAIPAIEISAPAYPIKKVAVNCKYNKASLPGVTISVTVGGEAFGDSYTFNTKETKTIDFTGASAASGDVVISFVNNSGTGTGKGTFYVYYVELTEGASGGTPTCATPTFDPEGGEFSSNSIDVEIASATEGVTIYYTTDGNDPTTSSNEYSTALNFTETTTLKAMAVKAGYDNSAIATATYTKVEPYAGSILEIVKGDFTTSSYDDNAGDHEKSGITFTTAKVYQSGGGIQFQKTNGLLYNKTDLGEIAKIEITTVSGKSNNLVVYSGTTENPTSGAVSGSASGSVTTYTFASGKGYFAIKCNSTGASNVDPIKIYYTSSASSVAKPTISGTDNFLTSTTVTISHDDADAIYYTTNGDAPTTSSAEYTAPFSLTNTATVKAIAVKGSDVSAAAEKTFTKATVLSVAEARAAIDAGGDLTNKFVAGVISQIDSYQSNYHSITYWISDDGTTTDQLEVYSGLAGVVKTQFESVNDLAVGDDVTVKGTLKKYNSTYEFDYNNTIEAYKPIARLAWSAESLDASLEGANTFPTLTNTNSVTVTYSSSDPAKASFADEKVYDITLNAVGSTTITATFAGNETYKANSASYTLNIASSLVTLTYNVDGGVAIDPANVSALPNPLPTTTKAGYNFGGWFTDPEKEVAAVPGAAITENTTLYAKWLDPYTVAEAKTVIDANTDGIANQYVAGIISQIDSYNNTYKSITYWISADGTTTNQLQVYGGLIGNAATALGKEDFSAKEDLELGDEVVVTGTLKLHNSTTYEFDKNNTIYTFSRKASAGLSYAVTAVNKVVGDADFVNELTNPNSVAVTYGTSDDQVAEVANDGTVTIIGEGTATISATFVGTPTYKAAVVSYTLTVSATVDTRHIANSPAEFASVSGNMSPDDIAYASYKGGAGNDPFITSGKAIRLYQISGTNDFGGFITLTAKAGCTIDEVQITTTSSYSTTVAYSKDGNENLLKSESVSASGSYTTGTGLNVSSVNILNLGTGSSGRLEIASIKVYYTGEPAAIDHYELGGTYQTAFMQGDEFNHTGLIVYAAYDALGENKVDITSMCTFSEPDMSTTGEKTIEITYNEAVVTSYTINVAADSRKVAESPATFTAVSGDMVPADITFASYKGGASNDPYLATGGIRLYQINSTNNFGGFITLKAKKGCTIDQVKITTSAEYATTVAYSVDGNENLLGSESVAKSSSYTTPAGLNVESVNILNLGTGSNGRLEIASIKVWYTGDALSVDHYILGGTYETTFEQYGTFSYEGLTVTAAYDAGGTITEAVTGFTVEADLNTAGATKANVMLNSVKIAEYDITVTASAKEDPALAYDPTSVILTKGDALSAPTFSNTYGVAVSYESDNEAVATVDAEGNIALAGGVGTAVITASFAGNEDYIESEATFTITVNAPAEDLSGTWVVATSIAAGDRIIIADVAAAGVVYTMGEQANNGTGNNRVAVESAVDEYGVLTPAAGTKTFLVVDVENGEFALQALNGNYLYAASNSSNHLKETSDVTNVNAKWTITIENGIATIKALHEGHTSRNWMRKNESSAIFSCYGSGQNDIVIYKLGTPDYGSYQRNVTNGNYGTICLPKAGVIEGAMLYNIGSYENGMIYVDEAGTTLEAGKPYIFQATANQLNVTYTSATVEETAGDANGLYGFYNLNDENAQKNLDQNDGNYILYQNQYWLVSGRAAYIANYRAYIKIGEITNAQPAPGIRRVAMQVNGQNTTTGVDNLNAGETPVKVMINGQMYILRGEKMYNANGQLVK